jgi:hypothetical protein
VFGRGEEEKSFYGYGFLKVSLWWSGSNRKDGGWDS